MLFFPDCPLSLHLGMEMTGNPDATHFLSLSLNLVRGPQTGTQGRGTWHLGLLKRLEGEKRLKLGESWTGWCQESR